MGAAAAIIPAAAGLAGGIFQGLGAQGASKQQVALAKQQMRDAEGQYADWLSGQTQLGGLRDQVVYQLMNQMGQSPQAFNPLNYGAPGNTGMQGTGGYDLNKEAQQAAAYQPGMGGTNTNVAQATLGQLGYSNASDIQTKNNPGSQSYSYGGYTYLNGQGPLAAETAGLQQGYTLQGSAPTGAHPPDWNPANPSGGWFQGSGKTYAPPGYAGQNAQGQSAGPPSSAQYAAALGLPMNPQHAGFSLGGGGAPGATTPAGPGTSGWGGAVPPGAAQYSGNATMNPPGRVGQGSQINWGS